MVYILRGILWRPFLYSQKIRWTEQSSSGVLVLPVLQDDSMTGLAVDVDEQAQGAIGKALALKDMEGKPASTNGFWVAEK